MANAFCFEDWISKELTSSVLYTFHCGLCNKSYYGECVIHFDLTLIWMCFLEVQLEVWGGGNLHPLSKNSLELCKKLEIWHISTHSYAVSEIIPFSTKALLKLLISAFLARNQRFFWQNSTYTQNNSIKAVLEIFWFCFQFL